MIKAKTITEISEQYFNTKKIYNKEVVLYKNPTVDDLKELVKHTISSQPEARVIVSQRDKAVYCWDAMLANHEVFYSQLNLDWWSRHSDPNTVSGTVEVQNNKLVCKRIRSEFFGIMISWIYEKEYVDLNRKRLEQFFKNNWTWVDKYLNGFNNSVNQLKQEYLEVLKHRG